MTKKRFSPTKKFTKKNIENIPKNKPIIYKIKNFKGTNIYTGTTKYGRVTNRLKEHLPEGPDPMKGAKYFQIKQMNSIKNAQKEEQKIIKREKPKFNE